MRIAEAIPQSADACVGFSRSQLRPSPCTSQIRATQMMFPLRAKKLKYLKWRKGKRPIVPTRVGRTEFETGYTVWERNGRLLEYRALLVNDDLKLQ